MSTNSEEKNGKKPKIALLHYSGPPLISGVELVLKDQARLFKQSHYSVEVVVGTGIQFRKDIPLHVIRRMDSANKYVLQVTSELEKGIVSSTFRLLERELYKKLNDYLVKNEITVCIVHNVMTRHYNLPLTAALIKLSQDHPEIKFIAWVHDLTFEDGQYTNIDTRLKEKYPWNLLSTYLPHWQYVCISEFRKKNLLSAFHKESLDNLTVIPNGVDVNKFFRLSTVMRDFYKTIGGRDADLIACTPVRIVRRKNIELGIRIAKEMVDRGKKFYLIVTANIDHHQKSNIVYFNELKALVKELGLENNVFFLSEFLKQYSEKQTYHVHVAEVYDMCDLLLMTSTIEGFGLPIIEAGLMKLPIFTSNIPPFHEIGETNIHYFNISDSATTIVDFILQSLKDMPQAYFYRKVIKKYSLQTIFSEKIIPLVEN